MPLFSEMSTVQLRARLEKVKQAIRDATPKEHAEMALIQDMLTVAEAGIGQQYAHLVGLAAILAVLRDAGKPLDLDAMFDLLVAGGYRHKTQKGKYSLRDQLNRYADPIDGRIVRLQNDFFALPPDETILSK